MVTLGGVPVVAFGGADVLPDAGAPIARVVLELRRTCSGKA
jgi:hypothetical protein